MSDRSEKAPLRFLFLFGHETDEDDKQRIRLSKEESDLRRKLRPLMEQRLIFAEFYSETCLKDLTGLIVDHRPNVLHISAHSTRNGGLLLCEERGGLVTGCELTTEDFEKRMDAAAGILDCVVLSGCQTLGLAERATKLIPCAVGLTEEVNDVSARAFSATFHMALASGQSLEQAMKLARTALEDGRLGQGGAFTLLEYRSMPEVSSLAPQGGRRLRDLYREWDAARRRQSGQESPAASLPHPWIPASWRSWVEKQFSSLEPLLEGNRANQFKTLEVYVPLRVSWVSPEEREAERRAAREVVPPRSTGKRRMARGDHLGADAVPDGIEPDLSNAIEAVAPASKPLELLAAHPKYRHFLIEGGPGSGKSTFLRHRALVSLKQGGDEVLPLFLELKDLGPWLKERKEHEDCAACLVTWAGNRLKDSGFDAGQLEARLKAGRLLWLLDGLDEIFDAGLRLRAARIIGRFVSASPDRVLVTSRPHALEDPAVLGALGLSDTHGTVESLNEAEQLEFLQRWFTSVYDGDRERAEREAGELVRKMTAHRTVSELRSTPLLLGTMASVYFQGKILPERRAELYERAIYLLLNRRFGHHSPGGSEARLLQARRALSLLARRMMEAGLVRGAPGGAEVGMKQFRSLLAEGWPSEIMEASKAEEKLDELAVELGSHSGLLQMRGHPPKFSFPHLGFQEYLAARHLANEPDPLGALESRLEQGGWRETILLVAGYLGAAEAAGAAEAFLKGLLERGGASGLELALSGASETPDGALKEDLLRRLRAAGVGALKSVGLNASERIRIGLALGRVGDPRLGMEREDRWVLIPSGTFTMGEGSDAHPVRITRDFWLGRYPVTNAEYGPFVEQGGYEQRRWWSKDGWRECRKYEWTTPGMWTDARFNASNQPVVGVSWYEAEAWCAWLTAWLSARRPDWFLEDARVVLPTEAQWELAARGAAGREYPWGNDEPDGERANFSMLVNTTSPVGTYPRGDTPDGVNDLGGNVWEWVADWHGPYPAASSRVHEDPAGPDSGLTRVLRGGSWHAGASDLRGAYRVGSWLGPSNRNDRFGFRVVLPAARGRSR